MSSVEHNPADPNGKAPTTHSLHFPMPPRREWEHALERAHQQAQHGRFAQTNHKEN